MLENLNTAVDHPGLVAGAADTLVLVEAVDRPGLRMNLDLYHAQIGEGNLIDLLRRVLPLIGEIQVADVPGRCRPRHRRNRSPRRSEPRYATWATAARSAWRPGPPVTASRRWNASRMGPLHHRDPPHPRPRLAHHRQETADDRAYSLGSGVGATFSSCSRNRSYSLGT